MNVSQLRTFIAVVERGSFSAAAKYLNISQPAVTMQVQALESDLGATLLDRRYRRIDLTEAGKTLLPHAQRVIEQLALAKDEITALSGEVSGRLAIAASTTPGVYVIPRLLGGFLDQYPEVGATISVHDTAEVVEAVESGAAQIGVTGATVRTARVSFEEVGTDQIIAIAPPGHLLANARRVDMADLAEATWIFRERGSGTRQIAEKMLADHGLDVHELRVAVELGTGEAIVSAVEGGLGIAMLSRYVAAKALAAGSVKQIDVTDLPQLRPFYMVLPKATPTRAAAAFREHLLAAMASA